MNEIVFLDSETTGLCGPMVLLQYAIGDGPVTLYEIWKEPVKDTLELIEEITNHPIVGFNLAFDWFQICKIYTTFSLLSDHDQTPEDLIEEIALIEPRGRDGDCVKPIAACDLMLVARKGPYQSLMQRKPIKIRRVPAQLAQSLVLELEERIKIKDIYFSKRKNKSLPKWAIRDIKDSDDNYDPHFKDLVLDFKASSALKVIANDLLGADRFGRDRLLYSDIEIDPKYLPVELGFAPFAMAMGASPSNNWTVPTNFPIRRVRGVDIRGKDTWPALIEKHIDHWHYNSLARQYAEDDVTDTRGVWNAFDCPEPGDVDSELACMVGASRWRGFTIDVEAIKKLKQDTIKIARQAPRSPNEVKAFLMPLMTPMEKLSFKSTKKMILEEIGGNPTQGKEGWQIDCLVCKGEGKVNALSELPCPDCEGSGSIEHPVARRARLVLEARKAKKDLEIYDKLLLAGRFHASFNVIGTLSNRMSGTDDLNPQAIRSEKKFRSCFPLYHPGTILVGGDFEAFEVSLAEANYNDKKLREELQSFTVCYKCSGKNPNCDDCHGTNQTKVKIHALFGQMCFPKMTYEEIVKDKIIYTRSKSGFFSQIYGGNYATLMTRLGVDEKSAIEAENRFGASYEGVRKAREKIFNAFCSMRQPAGIGTQVEWHEPADYIENMLDPPFRRYFLLENEICKALYELANKPPRAWRDLKDIKVWRRDREQSIGGAVQSALFGAAFQIQAANMRAAANHVIQSTGAEITKATQIEIWKLQPSGVHRWLVQPFNVHDEIECPVDIVNDPSLPEKVEQVVKAKVETYRPLVPLIGIDWKSGMKSWGDK